MGVTTWDPADTLVEAIEYVTETVAYWEGMIGHELGNVTHITLNVVNEDYKMTFFMVMHEPDTDAIQTDMFTITWQ